MKEEARKINDALKKEPKNKKLKQAKRALEKDFIPRQEKYEGYLATFQGRNSFSKSDPDSTSMCMKEDHMKNGQMKSGYNIQMGTENQFVVGFSVHQRAGDTSCLKPHLERLKEALGEYPETIIADAGYGSEENYIYLEQRQIPAFVKYNAFHYEQRKRYKKRKSYRAENFNYEAETDRYLCPQGKWLSYQYTKDYTTENGYRFTRRVYECEDCRGCPVKTDCTRAKHNRQIHVGVELERMKKEGQGTPCLSTRTRDEISSSDRGGSCFWQAQTELGLPQVLA